MSTRFPSPELAPETQMQALIVAFMAIPAIAVAAGLGIADLIAARPWTLDELGSKARANGPSLGRLLQLLTSIGIFAQGADGRYQQTPLIETLRRDIPRSLRDFAILSGSDFNCRPWVELWESIVTGQAALERVHGATFSDYLLAHPDKAEIVNAAMTSLS